MEPEETDTTEVKVPTSTAAAGLPNRKDAIAAAVAAAGVEDAKTSTADKEADSTETTITDTKVTDTTNTKTEDAEADRLLTQQGRDLVLAMQDPVKLAIITDYLARQAGYSKIETKTEVKEAKVEVKDDLREALGDEFAFLADKLGPAIDKILTKKLEENTRDIRENIENQQKQALQNQSAAALSSVGEDFFGKGEQIPDNVMDEMSKLMDKYPPSKDMSPREYIKDIFDMSVGRLGVQKNDKARQERTNKNRTDASSRLASERVPHEDNLRVDNSKPLSRREAIAKAVAEYKD